MENNPRFSHFLLLNLSVAEQPARMGGRGVVTRVNEHISLTLNPLGRPLSDLIFLSRLSSESLIKSLIDRWLNTVLCFVVEMKSFEILPPSASSFSITALKTI